MNIQLLFFVLAGFGFFSSMSFADTTGSAHSKLAKKNYVLSGVLRQMEAIGGEGTGCQMKASQEKSAEVDLKKTKLTCVENQKVWLKGFNEIRQGVERGSYTVFVAISGRKI